MDLNGKKLSGFDFTDASKLEKESDRDLVKVIRKGVLFGITMPSFKEQLTEEEATTLVRDVLRKSERGHPITSGMIATR